MTDRDDVAKGDLNLREWQSVAIAKAVAGSKAGEVPIEHERMVERLTPWGTDHELPPPDVTEKIERGNNHAHAG